MKVIVKDIQVEATRVGSQFIISDADANKIINKPSRVKRGRLISKDKLVDTTQRYYVEGVLHYALVVGLDDCYFNNVMLGK